MTQDEIDALINSSDPANPNAEDETKAGVDSPLFPEFGQGKSLSLNDATINDKRLSLLLDLQLPVSIELGNTNMLIRDILKLSRGSVIEFDKLVSEPVDVLVNGKKVAEGEVVVIDKHFGIRITSLVEPGDRLRGLKT